MNFISYKLHHVELSLFLLSI